MWQYKELPKISCLLVTAAGRLDFFKRSYQCYLDQTYPNRQLVIVNEGPTEYQKQISELVDNRQDVKKLFLPGQYTLGSLRNISIRMADGDLFVQWDDDDFNCPTRLMKQYAYLSKHPRAKICYLSDQLHLYFNTGELYWENWKFKSGGTTKWSLIPGTGMGWKNKNNMRYPVEGELASAGEDSVFASKFIDESEDNIALLSGIGYLQIYSYHGGNTFGISHHRLISSHRSFNVDFMLENKHLICKSLDYFGFDRLIKVMGIEGLAFVYDKKEKERSKECSSTEYLKFLV